MATLRLLRLLLNDISQILHLDWHQFSCFLPASPSETAMSQSPPLSSRHGGLDRRNRRLSIIQDTAVDNLHHVDTHALDDTSPSPHHELSMMSYMDAHSPKDESSYRCSPPSPLKSRSNSVVAVEKVEKNGKAAYVSCEKRFRGFWLTDLRSPSGKRRRCNRGATRAICRNTAERVEGGGCSWYKRCRGSVKGEVT